MRFVEPFPGALSWVAPEPAFMRRASHALVVDGRVWLVDAVAGPEVVERVRALGEPAGVLQLTDRHDRDGAALAAELGVALHRLPFGGVPGTPLRPIALHRNRLWNELALWWPEPRMLVCTESVGTAPYYRASGERLAVHPMLRVRPPRALAGLEPEHVLVGHGEPLSDGAATALRDALDGARRRAPAWLWSLRGSLRPRR